MSDWFDRHAERLQGAVAANASREAYTPFIESPSRRLHPEGAREAGFAAYQARLDKPFEMALPGVVGTVGEERSPYTAQPLGVRYPRAGAEALVEAAVAAMPAWRRAGPRTRVGIGMEILERWSQAVFENTYATMHTAGQGFMLGFAGSGASSLDRGLEALAMAWSAMDAVPGDTTFQRPFGGEPVTLHKRYRIMPVGVAVVLTCGSYPAWNAYPAILANLATGNPVVVKPHPDTILPVAIAVQIAREVIEEAGFSADLLTMACDTWDEPVAVELFDHPRVQIIDFTGGQRFGRHIEAHWPTKQRYTETAGCNSVVLESTDDLDGTLDALALGLVLFSAQMCTAPQNLWLPRQGMQVAGEWVEAEEVVRRLVAAVDRLVASPKTAAALAGALHSPATLEAMARLDAGVVRQGVPYAHPEFPSARTATPHIVQLEASGRAVAQEEQFGPMSFIILAEDRDAALAGAASDAARFGAIASYAYTTDPAFQDQVEEAFAEAGASVGINLVGQRPMNFTAAFSDFHVTGLNPAGTATLSDAAFVTRRFRIVQSKVEQHPGTASGPG